MNQVMSMYIFWCSSYTKVDAVILVSVLGTDHLGQEKGTKSNFCYTPGSARDCAKHFTYVFNALKKTLTCYYSTYYSVETEAQKILICTRSSSLYVKTNR